MSTVTLLFEDGRSVSVPAGPVDTVYEAALRGGVQLLTDCREGACATCKGRCTSGRYRHREFSDEALSPEEEKEGYVLTCQMQTETDCVVELPYPADDALQRRGTSRRKASVRAVERVAAGVVRLALAFEGGEPPFLPGQYVKIAVPGSDAVRSYSFANPPGNGEAEFFIRLLKGGAMSEYAANRAAAGDVVEVEGVLGHFYFRPSSRPALMVAGGTGLAPMLSMLDHIAATGQRPPRLELLYGVNRPGEFFALDRLRRHVEGLGLELRLACVEGGGAAGVATGFVTELLEPSAPQAAGLDAYLCGPPAMIVAAQTRLRENGVPPGRIFAEKFTPSS
jgi:benzoate/toluate 1,2-dioxygenase reductase component